MQADDPVERSGRIRQEATEWLVRMDGDASPDVIAAFNEWRARDPEHGEAFLNAMRAWSGSGALRRITESHPERVPTEFRQLLRMASTVPRNVPVHRRPVVVAAAAAVLTLAATLTALWFGYRSRDVSSAAYRTAVGEQATVSLRDGSRVLLNTNSEVRVSYNVAHTTARLVRGEALFTIPRPADGPFTVEAGGARIRSDGGEIEVHVDPAPPAAVVLAGSALVSPAPGRRDSASPTSDAVAVGPQQYVVIGDAIGDVQEANSQVVQRVTSWRDGTLRCDGWLLPQVVAEVNRYRTLRLQIRDERLQTLRFTGTIDLLQSGSFVRSLKDDYGVRVEQEAPDVLALYAAR